MSSDVTTSLDSSYVATVEIHRPPNNYFDVALIRELGDTYEELDSHNDCRAIVLCSEGKHFCAGADFAGAADVQTLSPGQGGELYREAIRLFSVRTPVIAAIQGAAVGGGVGLACSADFRIASSKAWFATNFSLLGFHHGFGLTVTLPRIVGQQRAAEMLYKGTRVLGDDALRIGLCDRLVDPSALREEAVAFASEIASAAPLAVQSIRETLRGDLVKLVAAATAREDAEQERLRVTDDWTEGIAAAQEKRTPHFTGR